MVMSDNLQYGTSNNADFEQGTWTFDMTNPLFKVSSGKFAIIDCRKLDFQMKLEHLMSIIDKYTLEEIEIKLP